jgi:hypothetical protein
LSLGAGDEAAILGVGAAALIAFGAGIFKASALRGDMNSKWARRVDLAVSALDEKTIAAAERLRDKVNELLPSAPFEPVHLEADPAPLAKLAERTVEFYKASTRMGRDLVVLRKVCPVIVGGLTAMEVAILALTAHYGELVGWSWLRLPGLILLGIAAVILVVTGAMYVVLQHRLASAEIEAGTGGRIDGDDE